MKGLVITPEHFGSQAALHEQEFAENVSIQDGLCTCFLYLAVQALVLGKGDYVTATTDNEGGMRFLLIAGRPIGEPIVQVHLPFCQCLCSFCRLYASFSGDASAVYACVLCMAVNSTAIIRLRHPPCPY